MENSHRVLCSEPPCERARNCEVLLGITHEVGNMLTAISGWAQFWEGNAVVSSEEGFPARYLYIGVGRIRHSLDRLAVRVGGGLDHPCRAMARSQARAHREVNVNDLVQMTLSALDPRIAAGYDVEDSREPHPWPILADYWALDIVLTNLIMDAATSSVPGSRLLVQTANVVVNASVLGIGGALLPGRYVTISVRDFAETIGEQRSSGCGSVEEQLPICNAIVREHGGLIQVLREATVGTTSVVFLPALSPRTETDSRASHIESRCAESRQ
jgi:signal transduction histidine kinase